VSCGARCVLHRATMQGGLTPAPQIPGLHDSAGREQARAGVPGSRLREHGVQAILVRRTRPRQCAGADDVCDGAQRPGADFADVHDRGNAGPFRVQALQRQEELASHGALPVSPIAPRGPTPIHRAGSGICAQVWRADRQVLFTGRLLGARHSPAPYRARTRPCPPARAPSRAA
jgi:hypothetical protein